MSKIIPILTLLFYLILTGHLYADSPLKWRIHSFNRPRPAIIQAGMSTSQAVDNNAPSDAIILFDGKDLIQWEATNGEPTKWIVKDGYMECVRGSGYIRTKRGFGDCQLHVEWATPVKVEGSSQGRGNSGVFLMGEYEVQVLDSYQNDTYPDGQAGAIYGQYPPLINASRKPGEWQAYDIIFHRPRFDNLGQVIKPARMTMIHNGVLVQDNVELSGPTNWCSRMPYRAHPDRLPLSLQDHGNPVRFRNIWVRELPDPSDESDLIRQTMTKEIKLEAAQLDRYVGQYGRNPNDAMIISRADDHLTVENFGPVIQHFFPSSPTTFFNKVIDQYLEFELDSNNMVTGVKRTIGGDTSSLKRL